jgi:aldehyde dehydrogenase (NAD+)
MQILHHFLSQEELNLETLRSIAKDLKIDTTNTQSTSQRRDSKTTNESLESEEAIQNDSEPDTEEIGDLHEQLGCLMQDSLGEYRSSQIERTGRYLAEIYRLCWSIL